MNRTRTTHLLLTAAIAVGAAHTALSARDRQRARTQTSARHHLTLLRAYPGYGSKLLEDKSEEESKTLVACNAWVSFWAAQFDAGVLTREHLRIQIDRFLDDAPGRGYWEWARTSWAQAPKRHYFRKVQEVFDEVTAARELGQAA
ncbi:DUF6082 family protein [Streptomyces sp. NBC_00237]|uniref:DUF6082 family protein n=1 Tax=Streptomyces sp. NBC_00237 TaxID=2975687 RepID=UPI002257215E|nr:DUF6082 family protein [Streptomyces sp. NBC_00237]MCX5206031.1 DUF6082 family protein [Streptomyces sp. NBC_00237]